MIVNNFLVCFFHVFVASGMALKMNEMTYLCVNFFAAHKFNFQCAQLYTTHATFAMYSFVCIFKRFKTNKLRREKDERKKNNETVANVFKIYDEKYEYNYTINVENPRKMRTNLLRIVVNHFVTRKSRHPL